MSDTVKIESAQKSIPPEKDPIDQALASLDKQLNKLQREIRELTQQRADAQQQDQTQELAIFDNKLDTLRKQRQTLVEHQFVLRRKSNATKDKPTIQLKQPPPPVTPKQKNVLTTIAYFIFRLSTVLVVFGGVAFFAIQIIRSVTDYLQPPPIEDIMANNDQAQDFSIFEGESLQERILSIYLVLNRDVVESRPSEDSTLTMFRVDTGETAREIASNLQEEGLITDETVFRRLLQYRGADQLLEAGIYELMPNMTMDEIILVLQDGRLQEITFTFLEGWRAEQMAAVLEEAGLASAEEYLRLIQQPNRFKYDFLNELPAGSSLEGYLFPDTYIAIKGQASAESIINTQLTTFERRVTAELRATATQNEVTLHQAIILASLVEREAVVAEERPIIAGVYINRWRDGTILNADPTIQYALGYQADSEQWWKRPLTREDLQIDSPYNTYTQIGLPPSPIASPGLDSIRATILAPKTDYYYFVSRNDGTHAFSITFEEHLENVEQYQSGN